MIIKTLSDDQIGHALTMAMIDTVHAMVDEGLIDQSQATAFADTHICLPVDNADIWHRIRRWIGMEDNERILVAKIFRISTKAHVLPRDH